MASLMATSRRVSLVVPTHYPLTSGPSLPRMVVYSGEGAAKYFDKDEARKRIYRGESIVWKATMLSRPHPTYYIDDGKAPELELAYFISLRFNYLPLKRGGSFITEPYNISSFNNFREEALHYPVSSWWERSLGKFLEDNLEVLAEKVGSNFVTLLEDTFKSQETTCSPTLNKRAFQKTSKASNDRCWKRQRVESFESEVFKTIEHPMGSPCERPQVSDESTTISRPKAKSSSNTEQEQKTSSASYDQTLKGLIPNSNDISQVLPKLNGAMSIFEGKGVVFNHKRKYILGLWEEICGKLSRTSLDNISSY
ncbi:hypothetical protein H5410_005317 [Solanum commersonii]|uniref:Uncharacterized protein n=1 Tax=Solanum commersonii TaxID=4109 RepID=A0A9J6A738_SOLCO|nr:hypothetical protein H5410_005317 [Solanum commersonii]